MGGLFYPKATMYDMFQALIANHPGKIDAVSLGKTYNNNDIMLFRLGNPSGGKVCFDAAIHGWEDIGSVMLYHYADWLLNSGEAEAARILAGNYTLIIPYVNVDSSERGNADYASCQYPFGVDLNRNFVAGWSGGYVCGNENNGIYGCTSGVSAASELETKAMRAFFQAYKPAFHVDHHYGGGPWLGPESGNNATLVSQIKTAIAQWAVTRGVSPFAWPWGVTGGGGMEIADSRAGGSCSWLWEVYSGTAHSPHADNPSGDPYAHTSNSLAEIRDWYLPHALPVYIAMSEACMSAAPPSTYFFSHWNNDLNDRVNPKRVVV